MSTSASMPPISDPLLTSQQVADFLGASLRTIQRRIADGTIRPVKLGGIVRIPASEITRIMDQPRSKESNICSLEGNVGTPH